MCIPRTFVLYNGMVLSAIEASLLVRECNDWWPDAFTIYLLPFSPVISSKPWLSSSLSDQINFPLPINKKPKIPIDSIHFLKKNHSLPCSIGATPFFLHRRKVRCGVSFLMRLAKNGVHILSYSGASGFHMQCLHESSKRIKKAESKLLKRLSCMSCFRGRVLNSTGREKSFRLHNFKHVRW